MSGLGLSTHVKRPHPFATFGEGGVQLNAPLFLVSPCCHHRTGAGMGAMRTWVGPLAGTGLLVIGQM